MAKHWIFLALIAVFLFSSFRWDVFHIEEPQRSYDILVDGYVIPAMELYADGPTLQRNLGEMRLYGGDNTTYPYIMQAGLQRMMYSWISPHSEAGVDRAIPYLRSLIAAALALAFTAFIFIVGKEFGYLTGLLTAIMLSLSDWLIVFGPELFWISVLFFIPFILAWLLGDPARPIKQQRLLAFLFTFFCLIKCLCGFDYITNISAGVAVPFIYYGLRRGIPPPQIALRIIRYGALSFVAFVSAILLQIMQLRFVEKVSLSGVKYFFSEARRRTMSNGEGIGSGYDNAVLAVLHKLHVPLSSDARIVPYLIPLRPLLRYVRYLTMGAITVPFPIHSLRIPIGFFVIGFALVFWSQRKRLKISKARPASRRTAWMIATLAALVISHLWVVAANGHMTHTFFNAIVFYIPFLPMAYVAVGIACVKLRDDLRHRKLHRRQELSV
ncbi:MAG TPA: hypothetical protein VFC39_14885 [Acidobacteriaceae bacterium]|nr:hypothetical protein [Acidobacteriaceae bacterium]